MTAPSGTRAAARSVLALVAGSGMQLGANVAAVLLATALLSVDERGVMVTIVAIAGLSSVIGHLGVGSAFRALRPREEAVPGALTSSYLVAGGVATVIAVALSLAAQMVLSGLGSTSLATPAALAAVSASTIVLLWTIVLADLRLAEAHFAASGAWTGAGAIAGLVTMAIGWLVGADTAASLVAAQAVGMASVLVASVVVAVRSGLVRCVAPRGRDVMRLLQTGVSMLALPLSIALLTRADRVVLDAVSTSAAVAVYALAATYTELLRIVPTAIGQLANRIAATGGALRTVLRLSGAGVATAAACALVVALGAWLVTVPLFGSAYADAPSWTLALLPAEIAYAIVAIVNFVLMGGLWTRAATILGAVAAIVGVAAYATGGLLGGAVGLIVARDLVMLAFAAASLAVAVILHRRRDRRRPPDHA